MTMKDQSAQSTAADAGARLYRRDLLNHYRLKPPDPGPGRRRGCGLGVVGLCISPDDAYVVWAQVDRNAQDLMLVENFR